MPRLRHRCGINAREGDRASALALSQVELVTANGRPWRADAGRVSPAGPATGRRAGAGATAVAGHYSDDADPEGDERVRLL